MKNIKKDIRQIKKEDLQIFFTEQNLPKFRAHQVFEWLWKHHELNFDKMSNLGLAERELLKETGVHEFADSDSYYVIRLELQQSQPYTTVLKYILGQIWFQTQRNRVAKNKILAKNIGNTNKNVIVFETGCVFRQEKRRKIFTKVLTFGPNLISGRFEQGLIGLTLLQCSTHTHLTHPHPLLQYLLTVKVHSAL